MTNIFEYIQPELLVLIPVLYLIGFAIKKSAINDKWIPLLLGGCGILLASLYIMAFNPLTCTQDFFMALFAGITQGVLVAAASVYGNQIVKQANKDKTEEEKEEETDHDEPVDKGE